jgi:cytochrome bd-type quinol oxidase subunit 1
MAHKIAFALIIVGAVILLGYAAYGLFSAPDIDLGIKLAMGAVALGFLILFGVVIVQRIRASKKEDYKEVKY